MIDSYHKLHCQENYQPKINFTTQELAYEESDDEADGPGVEKPKTVKHAHKVECGVKKNEDAWVTTSIRDSIRYTTWNERTKEV